MQAGKKGRRLDLLVGNSSYQVEVRGRDDVIRPKQERNVRGMMLSVTIFTVINYN